MQFQFKLLGFSNYELLHFHEICQCIAMSMPLLFRKIASKLSALESRLFTAWCLLWRPNNLIPMETTHARGPKLKKWNFLSYGQTPENLIDVLIMMVIVMTDDVYLVIMAAWYKLIGAR